MKPNADDPCAECGMSYREHDPDDFVPIGHDPTVSFAALLPPGTVALPRDRAARLIELAAALKDLGYIDFGEWPPQWDEEIDRLNRAREAIERTDYDPLPEEEP